MFRLYDNTPFRKRYQELEEKEDLSLGEVAARCGWIKVTGDKERCDSTRVARQLGLVPDSGKYKTHINEDIAKLFCKALHIDPVDIPGL